jgi:hypothetical protein
VKLPLCLINYALRHEDIWGSGAIILPLLTSALDGGKWSTLRPGQFIHNVLQIGKFLEPRSGVDVVENRNISCLCRETNPDNQARSLSAFQLSYPGSWSCTVDGTKGNASLWINHIYPAILISVVRLGQIYCSFCWEWAGLTIYTMLRYLVSSDSSLRYVPGFNNILWKYSTTASLNCLHVICAEEVNVAHGSAEHVPSPFLGVL